MTIDARGAGGIARSYASGRPLKPGRTGADYRDVLNWLARYAPVGPLLRDEDGAPHTSILDVGCGPHGLACAFPDLPFVGLEVDFPHAVAPSMTAFRAAPDGLPFVDGAFGTVLCLDVLEHIPRPARAPFVAELTRVAAERVILACPSTEDADIDRMFAGIFAAQGATELPYWLVEHEGFGLPTPDETAALAGASAGFTARPILMGNGLLSAFAALGDVLGPLQTRTARELAHDRERWLDLFATTTFGPARRAGWVIERDAPRVPVVTAADQGAGAAFAAVPCVECGGALAIVEDGLAACRACARLVPRDVTGAWDLCADRWTDDVEAAERFLCEPEWTVQGIADVLVAFTARPPAGEALLLRADPAAIRGEQALAVAQAALAQVHLSPGHEVVIVHEPLTEAQRHELAARCTVVDAHGLAAVPAAR